MFNEKYSEFWKEFGNHKKMVLSTSLNDVVTSRTMSIIVLDSKLYFQTDKTFKKYAQIKGNPNVALCIDNIQIEGICSEMGIPIDNTDFCNAYAAYFPFSHKQYTKLKNERLFVVKPAFIKKWIYIDNIPYIQTFDIKNKKYTSKQYLGI